MARGRAFAAFFPDELPAVRAMAVEGDQGVMRRARIQPRREADHVALLGAVAACRERNVFERELRGDSYEEPVEATDEVVDAAVGFCLHGIRGPRT